MSESSGQSQQGGGDGQQGQQNGGQQNGGQQKAKPNVRRSNFALVGAIVTTIVVVGLALGITKPEWQQYFTFGFTTREIQFAGDYFTLPNSSKVKVGGVEVGRIDSVVQNDDKTATYTVRVQSDIIDKVGSAPSANVRPTTLLGGIVYVDLLPGGDRTQQWTEAIPIDRTRLPVELNPVIQAIQPDAVKGIPATVNGLQGTLQNGGVPAIKSLAREAPGALGPGAGVINALTGQNPGTDLPNVVRGLQQTTSVLARKDGQIESILRDLKITSGAFNDSSANTALAIRKLPVTLDTAKAGLARLSITLDKLRETAPEARPIVRELDRLLARIDPVLVEARPVINNLRFALQETRPLVEDLVPAAQDLRYTFNSLDPSLDRLRGPVVDALETGFETDGDINSTTGQVEIKTGTSVDTLPTPLVSQTEYTPSIGRRHGDIEPTSDPQDTLREEFAQFLKRASAVSGYNDDSGHAIGFNLGFGPDSINGIPGFPTTFATFQQALLAQLLRGGAFPPLTPAGMGTGALRLPVPGLSSVTGGLPNPGAVLRNPAGALAKPGVPLAAPRLPVTGAAPGSLLTPGRATAPGAVRAPATAPARPAAPALPGTGLLTGGAR